MADKQLKKLRLLRLTEINRLNDINALANAAKDNITWRLNFRMRADDVNSIKDEFFRQHNLIIGSIDDNPDTFKAEDEIRKQFETVVGAIKAIYFQLFSPPQAPVPPPASASHIKLPTIDLPSFDGDITMFTSYIDMFNSLIHSSTELTLIEKFNYLLASLKGDALAFVQHFPVKAENYNLAYSELTKRYQNQRQIVRAHWSAIDNAKKVNYDHPQEIRDLIDIFSKNIKALKNSSPPIDLADFLTFSLMMKKCDSTLITRFELHHNSDKVPTFDELSQFLEKQWSALENANVSSKSKPKKFEFNKPSRGVTSLVGSTSETPRCPICAKGHLIYKCSTFLHKLPSERHSLVKDKRLCFNCLSSGHSTNFCQSSSGCHKCGHRHHTLLHFQHTRSNANVIENSSEPPPAPSTALVSTAPSATTLSCSTNSGIIPTSSVLLSTALVKAYNNQGGCETLRVLLDSGSQTSFITSNAAQKLQLPKRKSSLMVNGLAQTSTFASSGAVTVSIRPVSQSSPRFVVDAIILPKICDNLPSSKIVSANWSYRNSLLNLADPHFDKPGQIDMLLGADVFPQLLRSNHISGQSGEPDALETVFGYVLIGKVTALNAPLSSPSHYTFLNSSSASSSLEETVQKFWEVENVPQAPLVTPDDDLCDKLFTESHDRDNTGRYVVSLPFRGKCPSFSNNRDLALRRFLSLEKRLLKQPSLYKQYCDFMQEYLDLNHMEPVSPPNDLPFSYYIPHFCVLKPDSLTTKLRVVFDASAHDPGETSLNDHLLVGPKLQQDIVTILLNFRFHAVVFTADIKMMYRQILLHPSQRDYQRILWRFSPKQPIQDYRLLTLTYGVSSSPYLSIRTLLQLADDEGCSYPLAASSLRQDTYIDDIVTGGQSSDHTRQLRDELISLLDKGKFCLRKWASNDPSLLADLPSSDLSMDPLTFDDTPETCLKILGLQWNPHSDSFKFYVNPQNVECTKRNLLSNLARIFDPLGILSPVTFFIKHLIQRLWSMKLGWDDQPPNDILRVWEGYITDLSCLESLSLPRRLIPQQFFSCELHGFGDSSEKGYCAVIYFVCTFPNGERHSYFVCSKSKVAPLKRISIPRLELCAAVLLTRLIDYVLRVYQDKLTFSKVCAWSDSTVVLSWIASSPSRWKTFVANRVAFIQETLPSCLWCFVSTSENPADVGSRGMLPSSLVHCSLWWAGPSFLKNPLQPSPPYFASDSSSEVFEEERTVSYNAVVVPNFLDNLLSSSSSLSKILNIIAYLRRFIHNSRSPASDRFHGSLTSSEIYNSLMTIVRHVQQIHFSEEIEALREERTLPKSFQKLSPFIDDQNILRVGSRLKHAPMPFGKKFPAILPTSHILVDLLINHVHQKYYHAGHQTVQFLLGSQVWILSFKKAIRRVLSKCVRCFRVKPSTLQPPMGDLPAPRVSKAKPFLHVGVDYAGPFLVTMTKSRGGKSTKTYLCLFVCLVTKALHLELASDLTTEAFLAALRRFIARRGRCEHIYSDCGTNFVGAHRELQRLTRAAASQEHISWHFNPPSAPHFGGLFEAGVKSVKNHLLRVIGDQVLSYEELNTLFAQIESLLNSRPLCPLSNDPNDLQALSPAHFLTLEPLTALPEPSLSDIPVNRLNRWQLIQRLYQNVWSRWSKEYLQTLHQRSKWHKALPPLQVGTLVLIKNELTPSLHWRMGRIVQLHPGPDGITRVVTLKTASGPVKRPVVKICPLPIEN